MLIPFSHMFLSWKPPNYLTPDCLVLVPLWSLPKKSFSLSFQFCHDSVKSVAFVIIGLLILFWARLTFGSTRTVQLKIAQYYYQSPHKNQLHCHFNFTMILSNLSCLSLQDSWSCAGHDPFLAVLRQSTRVQGRWLVLSAPPVYWFFQQPNYVVILHYSWNGMLAVLCPERVLVSVRAQKNKMPIQDFKTKRVPM